MRRSVEAIEKTRDALKTTTEPDGVALMPANREIGLWHGVVIRLKVIELELEIEREKMRSCPCGKVRQNRGC